MVCLNQHPLLNGLQEQPQLIRLLSIPLLSLSPCRAMMWLSACKFRHLPPSIEMNLFFLTRNYNRLPGRLTIGKNISS